MALMVIQNFALVVFIFTEVAYGQECQLDGNASSIEETCKNWEELILPMVNVSQLWGETLVIATPKDFPVGSKDMFKHVKYPSSFQTTLTALDNELSVKPRNDMRLFMEMEAAFKKLDLTTEYVIIQLLDTQDEAGKPNLPISIETLKTGYLEDVSKSLQGCIANVAHVENELRKIPEALSELANITIHPSTTNDITDRDYIAAECLHRLKLINTILHDYSTSFFQEVSSRLENMKIYFDNFKQSVLEAAENTTVGNKRVFCERFLLRKDIRYVIVMTQVFATYTTRDLLASKGQLLNTETGDYISALEMQGKKAKEDTEAIKKIIEAKVNWYDNWVKSELKKAQAQDYDMIG